MKEISVTVEQKHLLHGQRKQCQTCPLALALLDLLPENHWVSILYDGFHVGRWNNPDGQREILASGMHTIDSLSFVMAFDRNKPVEPATLYLIVEKDPHNLFGDPE